MLTEIHKWFVDNLKSTTAVALVPATSMSVESQAAPFADLHFELYEHSRQDPKLICPRASLSQQVAGTYSSTSLKNSQLFNCDCTFSTGDSGNHRQVVEAYGCKLLT
jgi:hypothetical protein